MSEDVSKDDLEAAERAAEEAAERLSLAPEPFIDFNTFVISLSSTALVHLGAAPPEVFGGQPAPPANLPMAKQTIDLIAMLEEKTHGNLTGEEERLLQTVLYDLRMRYVKAVQK
ncbi:MAG: DUF1844 domain-containing protein [Myxococcota bacterium]